MKLIVNSDLSLVKSIKAVKDAYDEFKWAQLTINAGTRTLKQNSWINKAYEMLSIQGDQTFLQYRCESKYLLGLPILMEAYPDEAVVLRPMLESIFYEDRLRFMLHYPVTSRFNLKQGKQYIEEMIAHYSGFEMPGKEDIK